MYSPHRLDTPPPRTQFRRPWSPEEDYPIREATDASFEALDLADYSTTLHYPHAQYQVRNMHSPIREPFAAYIADADDQYPEYPSTPYTVHPVSSMGSIRSPPSLVSAGSSPSRSSQPYTPTQHPRSLPHLPQAARQLWNPADLSTRYASRYGQSPEPMHGIQEVDTTNFPEWSRSWHDQKNMSAFPHTPPVRPLYDLDTSTHSYETPYFPVPAYASASGSHRSLLPWSGEQESPQRLVTPEMKEERFRMLEKEFGRNATRYGDAADEPVIGGVDSKGNLITDGPKKRTFARWAQGTFALGAAIASIYSALILKPSTPPPPRGSVAAYLLYLLSVSTVIFMLYMFVFRRCCCGRRQRPKSFTEGPAGMMVLPVQGEKKGKRRGKKTGKWGKKGGDGQNDGVQVNLIVDPAMFARGTNEEDGESVSGSVRPTGRRRGVFEGLRMEEQWRYARGRLKRQFALDMLLMVLWGAEFVMILIGKRCPVGQFEGWCDGYNVATALTCFLTLSYGYSVYFGIKDLHASKASPRTRT